MTAGVEGLPTGARDRLAEALPHLLGCLALVISMSTTSSSASGPCICFATRQAIAVTLLPVVAELCEEAQVEGAADALMWSAWTVEHSPGIQHQAKAVTAIRARARALTAPQQQPTCQQRHTESAYTWLCLQPSGHGDQLQHEDSAGHRW